MTIPVVNKGNFSHVELKNQKAPSSCPYLTGSGGKRHWVHSVVQGTEVRSSHLTSSSKLFAVLSTPIMRCTIMQTYMLPQFPFYSNMSGHFMSAHSQLPMEATGKARSYLTDTAPGLDLAQSQLSTSRWQIILFCFKGVRAMVRTTEYILYLDYINYHDKFARLPFCILSPYKFLWIWKK